MTEDGIPGVVEEILEGEKLVVCHKCYLHPATGEDGTPHEELRHPWRAEVDIGEPRWGTNALTFLSESDAKAYVFDLMMRWTMVRDTRVVPTTTPEKEFIAR